MIGKQVFRTCITIFLIVILLCPSFGMLNTSTKIIGTAGADYVDASNNTSCIEEDPLVPGWSKDVRLTEYDGKHSNLVDICVDKNDVIHVVWEDQGDESGFAQIYYSKSENSGITWSDPKRITKVSPNSENRGTPNIVVSEDNTLHLVWVHWIPYNREIYYMRSINSGDTWSDEIRLTNTSTYSETPRIGCYKNILHLVWIEQFKPWQLYYAKSVDNGIHWSKTVPLTNLPNGSGSPSLYVDKAGNPHVVWQYEIKKHRYNIYYIKSTDGDDWSSVIPITNESNGVCGVYPNPKITGTSDGSLHVIWRDDTSPETTADVAYSKSYNLGDNWTASVMLTHSSILTINGNAGMPYITSDPHGNLYIVWKSTNHTLENETWIADSNDVYFVYSKDGGESWEDIVRLTYASGWGRNNPRVVTDSKGIVHIVWGDGRHAESYEIVYKRSLHPIAQKQIMVTQLLNQTACKPGDSIIVSGNAVYNDFVVPNANVTIKILETGDEWTTLTDSEGDYSKSIVAPNIAGNYTIRVTITSDNHTGWKQMRLTVEEEGTTGGQQPGGGEANQWINLNYVIVIAVIAVCIIIGFLLIKRRGKTAVKTEKEKTEKNTMNLRCPKCRQTFKVELKPKPFNVKCPHCGKEGVIK